MTDSFQSYFFFFFAPMNSPNESSLRVNRELNDVERDRGNATFLNEIFSLAKTRPFLPPLFTEIERERDRYREKERERYKNDPVRTSGPRGFESQLCNNDRVKGDSDGSILFQLLPNKIWRGWFPWDCSTIRTICNGPFAISTYRARDACKIGN